MGAFIAKQPNGLYCRFSSVIDCPTDWNMTEDDYIELCAEKAREEARHVLKHYLKPFDWVEKHFAPNNMSQEEFDSCMADMCKPVTEELIYDDLSIFVPSMSQIIRISEGDGTNLQEEDIQNGYVDYIYYDQYELSMDFPGVDGGQVMLKKPFRERFKSMEQTSPEQTSTE